MSSAAALELDDFVEYTENELLASICRSSFADFLREFWSVVVPEKLVWNWHIQYLCDELQKIAERVFRGEKKKYDLIINISPGTSKSTIATIMFPAWLWTRMASCRVISASYSYDIATDLSRKSRDVVKSEKFRELFPGIDIREDQDAKSFFVNTKGGERYAIGVDGGVMGKHAHVIIVDDPLNPKEAASDADLAAANRWMEETLPSRKVDKRITPTIIIMQRLHEADPTGMRLEKAKKVPVKHICLPAELTDNVKPPSLRDFYVDGLMDPHRLDWDAIGEAEAQGEFVYSSQYLQTPIPRGGAMFDTGKLNIAPRAPDRADLVSVVRYWDKASGTEGGGAYTVGALLGKDVDGNFWILDIVRVQYNSGAREKLIRTTALQDGKRVKVYVEQEPGSGGKDSAMGTVRTLAGFRVRVDKVGKSQGNKELRADAFSTQVNHGNVYMVKAQWNREYLNEMRHFPRSRHKDQIDASSGAFNVLAGKKTRVGGRKKLQAALRTYHRAG